MSTTRIKGYTFHISDPFHPGTVITKGEAQALNELRVENIANNLRGMVARALEGLAPGELLSQEKLAELQTAITRYDHGYVFVEKQQLRPRLGDLETEALAVGREVVLAALRREGVEVDEEEIDRLTEQKASDPQVQATARERVAAKRRALSGGLDTL